MYCTVASFDTSSGGAASFLPNRTPHPGHALTVAGSSAPQPGHFVAISSILKHIIRFKTFSRSEMWLRSIVLLFPNPSFGTLSMRLRVRPPSVLEPCRGPFTNLILSKTCQVITSISISTDSRTAASIRTPSTLCLSWRTCIASLSERIGLPTQPPRARSSTRRRRQLR